MQTWFVRTCPTTRQSNHTCSGTGTFYSSVHYDIHIDVRDIQACIVVMLLFLDHPGFIERSLRNTQDNGQTDVSKWLTFCETLQKDVESVTLLATVLLTANVSFLAIQTVDSLNGLHTWPQRLSYMSLLSALGCILMGLAVRVPRCFTAYNDTYFQLMALVLGFPFELFLYSIVFFIAALIERFRLNSATLQIIAAAVVISLVIMCLFVYWLITEPLEEQQQKASSQRDAAVGGEGSSRCL
ncbi:hypothetical protein EDD16DRAFT_1557965, partial [Pisolithus croceorrhizus]